MNFSVFAGELEERAGAGTHATLEVFGLLDDGSGSFRSDFFFFFDFGFFGAFSAFARETDLAVGAIDASLDVIASVGRLPSRAGSIEQLVELLLQVARFGVDKRVALTEIVFIIFRVVAEPENEIRRDA